MDNKNEELRGIKNIFQPPLKQLIIPMSLIPTNSSSISENCANNPIK
jgi:hypothetical protein